MELEEPDTATAGTAVSDDGSATARQRRTPALTLTLAIAVLTIAAAVGVSVFFDADPSSPAERETVARHTRSQGSGTESSPGAPGAPVVSIGAPGPNGCPASWSVDDGGSPLVHYLVTLESAPAPPGAAGTEIGTALQVERTTATTSTVSVGGTIRVSGENALGAGPTSAPLLCG